MRLWPFQWQEVGEAHSRSFVKDGVIFECQFQSSQVVLRLGFVILVDWEAMEVGDIHTVVR